MNEEQKFIRMPVSILKKLTQSWLTATEMRLFHWLIEFDPTLGDRVHELPSYTAIAKILDVHRATVSAAMDTLDKEGLYSQGTIRTSITSICSGLAVDVTFEEVSS